VGVCVRGSSGGVGVGVVAVVAAAAAASQSSARKARESAPDGSSSPAPERTMLGSTAIPTPQSKSQCSIVSFRLEASDTQHARTYRLTLRELVQL